MNDAQTSLREARRFVDALRLYTSLPRELQGKIVQALDEMEFPSKAVPGFCELVDANVAIFTSNA